MFRLHKQGFSLIELLIVIFVIGIIASLSVILLVSLRAKARDTIRVSDIKQITTGLALYYSDENSYPTIITPGNALVGPSSGLTYIKKIPNNPLPSTDGSCEVNEYAYTAVNNGQSFQIVYCLGQATGEIVAGNNLADPTKIGGEVPSAVVYCDGSGATFACGSDCVYEGVTYPTVQIAATTTTQCWLAKNLNVGTKITGATNMTNDGVVEKWCYNDNETNPAPTTTICANGQSCGGCDTDGGLYTWSEAMGLSSACNSSLSGACDPTAYVTGSGATAKRQGICPSGWHIPSDYEWWGAENYLDATIIYDNPDYFADQYGNGGTPGYRGTNSGTRLKCSTSGATWTDCGDSNLKLLIAGYRNAGSFSNRGTNGHVWVGVHVTTNNGWVRRLDASGVNSGKSSRTSYSKSSFGHSVRCVKDS